nr:hypothetical protein [Pleurocapsa sp. PCC 7319]
MTISPELTISCSSMTNFWLIRSTIYSSSIIPATIPKWLMFVISIPVNISTHIESQSSVGIQLYLFAALDSG